MRSLALLLPATLLLSGCLGDVMEIFCEVGPDPDHCYQATAVQESEPEDCAKIAGEGFQGSNPPKDKCFLQIAQNTGDPTVCDGIEGGFMSYSKEECLENVFKNHAPEECETAADERACRTAYFQHGKAGCGDGFGFHEEKKSCVPKGELPSSDDGIDDKVGDELKSFGEAAGGKYMELLENAIDGEQDPDKLRGLQAYKEFLEKSGEKLEELQTNLETLEQIKKIFIDSYDPSMDIERMRVDKILAKGFLDRASERLFGPGPDSGPEKENADAGDALTVYQKMLERQGEIDELKKSRMERLQGAVVSGVKDKATDKLKESVGEIAEKAGGTAFAAVGIVDHALTALQEEAKNQMFSGLARAYNRRREELEKQNPALSPEKIHEMAVSQVKEDPYRDNTNTGFVKHGNLLENKDCGEEEQPLCINGAVWWTALDKTYEHTHKPKR